MLPAPTGEYAVFVAEDRRVDAEYSLGVLYKQRARQPGAIYLSAAAGTHLMASDGDAS